MSLQYLKDSHSDDQGNIKVDNCEFVLNETVKRIDEYQSADIDIEVAKVLESDLMENIARSLVMRKPHEAILAVMELEGLVESNLKELISDLLEAG